MNVIVGGVYEHYLTGKWYQVNGFARNPNSDVVIVIYDEWQTGNPDEYWRPVLEFKEKFTKVGPKKAKDASDG